MDDIQHAVQNAKAAQNRALSRVEVQTEESLEALPERIERYTSLELAEELDRISDLLKKRYWLRKLAKE